MKYFNDGMIAASVCALLSVSIFSAAFVASTMGVGDETVSEQSDCVKTELTKAHLAGHGIHQRELGMARGVCSEIAPYELIAENG